jgi:hypothetical protein
MTDDPIVATIMAKYRSPAEPAGEEAEPAAVVWPALGQGERGTHVSRPPDPLLAAVLDELGIPRHPSLGPVRR